MEEVRRAAQRCAAPNAGPLEHREAYSSQRDTEEAARLSGTLDRRGSEKCHTTQVAGVLKEVRQIAFQRGQAGDLIDNNPGQNADLE